MNLKSRHGLCVAFLLLGGVFASAARSQYLETVIGVGANPGDVLWNPASNKVYTANNQSGSVTVIDGVSNQILATVAVADYPVSLCWNSVNNKVYATCGDPDWLYVIDGVGDTVVKKVRMRGYPNRMVFNATMNKLYVNCADDNMIRVYDGAADTLVAEVWLGELNTPYTMLWHPVSNRVFCTTWGNADSVMVIDCALDAVAERLSIGNNPYAMCWNRVNDLLYVDADGGIRVLTAAGDSIVDTVLADAGNMCFVPCPNKIYAVTNWTVVIDCDLNVVAESLSYRGDVTICDTFQAKVYSASRNVHQLYVYDARADTLRTTIPMGSVPEAICWNQTNSRVYIADAMDDVVYVVRDTATGIQEQPPFDPLAVVLQARPNPFTRSVAIVWDSLVKGGDVARVYAQDGRLVRQARIPAGEARWVWDGRDDCGAVAPPGVYVLEAGSSIHKKVVKLK